MSLVLSPEGERLIKGFEVLRLTGYLPTPNDKPTRGWGHTGPEVRVGEIITPDQAEEDFRTDTAWAAKAANAANDERSVEHAPLLQRQFDSLCSIAFNIGLEAFNDSHLRKAIVAADERATGIEWARWVRQGRRVLPGLVARRAKEWRVWSGLTGSADDQSGLTRDKADRGSAPVVPNVT